MRRIYKLNIIILTIIALAFKVNAQNKFNQTNIVDLALIYYGGEHRSSYEWTKERFEPYVSYKNSNGQNKWLFDGFLFLEFKDGKGRQYAPGYDKLNARKSEWQWLIDKHFLQDKGFRALNQVISEKRKVVKKKHFKHKIIMGLPSPIHNQEDWGKVNDKNLIFNNKEDRLTAIKWYIDEFLDKYKKSNLKHLDLAGFYWVDEDNRNGRGIENEIGQYIRTKGLKFYWIPYWNASGNTKWKEMGFDFAWLQPNHFFHSHIPNSRIQEACDLANEKKMGLEMEFDDNALAANKSRDRFIAYVDIFKQNGVFDQSSIAYYQGGDAFYKLFKSNNKLDTEAYHMLADLLAKRKEKSFYFNLIKK